MVKTKAETTKKRKSFSNKKRKKKKRKHTKHQQKQHQQQQQQEQQKSKLNHGVKNENFELRNVGKRIEIEGIMVDGSNYDITTTASSTLAVDSDSSRTIQSKNVFKIIFVASIWSDLNLYKLWIIN